MLSSLVKIEIWKLFRLFFRSLKVINKVEKVETDCWMLCLNAIPTPVLMHFLFLYFRFFITYFPFLIKNLVFPSLTPESSNVALLRMRGGKCRRKEKRETFSVICLKVEACDGSKWSNFLFMQQFYGL